MLTPEQVECLDLMVNSNLTQKAIAKKIKMSEQTICNWKKDPEFVEEHKKLLRATLRSVATKASRTLVALLEAESEQVRLNAAKDILDRVGLKPEEKVEIRGDVNNPFAGLSTEELKKLIDDD